MINDHCLATSRSTWFDSVRSNRSVLTTTRGSSCGTIVKPSQAAREAGPKEESQRAVAGGVSDSRSFVNFGRLLILPIVQVLVSHMRQA
jgi:hypothetical protein